MDRLLVLMSYLMAADTTTHIFAPVNHHIFLSLTNPSAATSINPKCIVYSYNMLTNINLDNKDPHLILN